MSESKYELELTDEQRDELQRRADEAREGLEDAGTPEDRQLTQPPPDTPRLVPYSSQYAAHFCKLTPEMVVGARRAIPGRRSTDRDVYFWVCANVNKNGIANVSRGEIARALGMEDARQARRVVARIRDEYGLFECADRGPITVLVWRTGEESGL